MDGQETLRFTSFREGGRRRGGEMGESGRQGGEGGRRRWKRKEEMDGMEGDCKGNCAANSSVLHRA